MIRIAIRFAYLGDRFSGSQVQPGVRTVEGEMKSTLRRVLKTTDEELNLRIASRTDRGVSALGNVAVLNSPLEDPEVLLRALNAVSDDVFYTSFALVDDDFNPRRASYRTYRYVLPSEGMDIGLARECASLFVGEHDFRRFCRPDGKPTIVTIDSIDVSEEEGAIVLTYTAEFFLWNMVRRIAAAIREVASGHSTLADVSEALEGRDVNFGIARPDALTLMDVSYEGVSFIPCRSSVLLSKTSEGEFSSGLRLGFYRAVQDLLPAS